MIGKLTIDKASMNISYFLYTVRIIDESNGRISRKDFGKKMGDFIGVPSMKGGKENRTPYNKSKLPRYFGFVDIESDANTGISYLVLTHRGKVLLQYIQEKGEDVAADQRFCILPEYRDNFIDLIFESVIFDSFGKNNCGAEQSNTDIEPPKVVFKTIYELGKATAEEICYVMFGMNRGEFKTFDEAIEKVRHNRSIGKHDYKTETDAWDITNIVNDCKIINIFTDDNIQLLYCEKDDEDGKTYYYLSKNLGESHIKQIATISTSYQPLKLFAYTDGNIKTVQQWVDDAVLGRVSNNSFVFRYDKDNPEMAFCWNSESDEKFKAGVFEEALLKAYQNEKNNVYIIVNGVSENSFQEMMEGKLILFRRVNDYLSDEHGWSEQPAHDINLHNYLVTYSPRAKQKLASDEVLLPSNLHIVGTVIMENSYKDIQFDYEFQRCLISTDKGDASTDIKPIVVDEKRRKTNGRNVLLYGVPGSGKSWTIDHEYCKKGYKIERLVFHPDYTYSDFIGQILPNVADDGQVSYKFTAGPFTNILKEAYIHPEEVYVLIIEEINRGNAPAIFGEVFQLLDRKVEISETDDDGFPIGTSEYGITNANIARIVYGDPTRKVRIPSNLSIIGTMNTSDQNVFTLDTAFQRRWDMRLIENNFDNVDPELANAEILDTTITWKNFCTAINGIVVGNSARMTSSEDKRLGAYFVHLRDLKKDERMGNLSDGEYDGLCKKESAGTLTDTEKTRLAEIREAMKQYRKFPEKVIKYLWDDAFKFNREVVFESTEYQSLEQVIRAFMYAQGIDRFKMFKENVVSDFRDSKQ